MENNQLVDSDKKHLAVMVLTLKNTAECSLIEMRLSQGKHADSQWYLYVHVYGN